MNYSISWSCSWAGTRPFSTTTCRKKGITCVSSYSSSPSVSYNDPELQRQEATTCSGHISETETFIKQLVPSSCGAPQALNLLFIHFGWFFLILPNTVMHCLVCCDFLVAGGGVLAYCSKNHIDIRVAHFLKPHRVNRGAEVWLPCLFFFPFTPLQLVIMLPQVAQ